MKFFSAAVHFNAGNTLQFLTSRISFTLEHLLSHSVTACDMQKSNPASWLCGQLYCGLNCNAISTLHTRYWQIICNPNPSFVELKHLFRLQEYQKWKLSPLWTKTNKQNCTYQCKWISEAGRHFYPHMWVKHGATSLEVRSLRPLTSSHRPNSQNSETYLTLILRLLLLF